MLTLSDTGARQGYAVHKTSGHSKSHQMTLLDSGLPLFVYFFFLPILIFLPLHKKSTLRAAMFVLNGLSLSTTTFFFFGKRKFHLLSAVAAAAAAETKQLNEAGSYSCRRRS